jgi:hypothetical protein
MVLSGGMNPTRSEHVCPTGYNWGDKFASTARDSGYFKSPDVLNNGFLTSEAGEKIDGTFD